VPPLVRAAVLLPAALAFISAAVGVGLSLADGVPPELAGPAGAIAFGATGALVALRRPDLVLGRLLLLAGVSFGLSGGLSEWARSGLIAHPGALPGAELALWAGSWVWVPGYCAVAALLPLRLPDGHLPPGRLRRVWPLAMAVTVLATLGWATTPYADMDRPPLEGVTGLESPAGLPVGSLLLNLALPLLAVCALAGLVSLGLRLRRSVGEERQQGKWVVYGATMTVLLLVAGWLVEPDGHSDAMLAVALLPLPLSVAVAALRYRLWDVDRLIDRTLVYLLLTATVVAVYVGAVLVLGDFLGARTGAPLLATVLVALGAEPARRRMQLFVDRAVRGDRADPYQAVVGLSSRLEDAASAPAGSDALHGVAEAVASALSLPWVVVSVLGGPVAQCGTRDGTGVRVPLVHAGQLVGELHVGARRVGRDLSPGDLRLLDDLAGHVAVAAHAAQLRDALQRSRERLVSAREEERRRLRRDLHDDLGPVLAAVALQLGEIRDRAETDGPTAAALAARAERLLTGAVASVRKVVEGLRPAALDELGLAGALRTLAEGFATSDLDVAVEVRGDLSGLPAATEVAALRVATEALHNAARHAGAGRVRLGVERVDDALEVTVADDGRGLPEGALPGVGLTSMRERTEELGGTWTVQAGPAGTAVMARLPLQRGAETASVSM
jgi:two-component system, NarL family, sensor kinase